MVLQWLLIGAGLLFLAAVAVRHYSSTSPAALARGLRNIVIGAIIVADLVLVLSRRLPWQTAIGVWFLPLVTFLFDRWSRAAQTAEPSPGQSSRVATRFLKMNLDHDTGKLDGLVVEGTFAGRTLSAMSLDELRALLGEAAVDPDSLNVLAAYLDRMHGDAWREAAGAEGRNGAAGAGGAMTREEAYNVLGLGPGASKDEIRAAHRKLMKLAHPDHGGSDYLASKINEAKDLLLGS